MKIKDIPTDNDLISGLQLMLDWIWLIGASFYPIKDQFPDYRETGIGYYSLDREEWCINGLCTLQIYLYDRDYINEIQLKAIDLFLEKEWKEHFGKYEPWNTGYFFKPGAIELREEYLKKQIKLLKLKR